MPIPRASPPPSGRVFDRVSATRDHEIRRGDESPGGDLALPRPRRASAAPSVASAPVRRIAMRPPGCPFLTAPALMEPVPTRRPAETSIDPPPTEELMPSPPV